MNPQKEMSEMTVEQITRTAVQTALEYLEKEKRQQQKSKRDGRLRNTRLLLKHYRSFVEHCEDLEEMLSSAQEAKTLDDLYSDDFAVESIKRSKRRTMVMVHFIQRMMSSYRIMCESSGHLEDIRRYKTIDAMYITDEKLSVEAIAECHKVEVRTIYRDINDAAKTLSVLIFGVDGVQFE